MASTLKAITFPALVALLLCSVSIHHADVQARHTANLVIRNGKLWTVDPNLPRAEAIAVLGDRIVAVGSDSSISPWIGDDTRVLDARGGSVLPGFIDSHVHVRSSAAALNSVHLRDASTPEEFVRRVAEFAGKTQKGEWILGGSWDHELWTGTPLPTRQWIDAVTPNNPVLLNRYDGHMRLANSLALQLAGITGETPNPQGGFIVKDQTGQPTGLLKDSAIYQVLKAIPAKTPEDRMRDFQAALHEAARFGVTGFDDISSAEDVRIYQMLASRGQLTARVYCITPIQEWEALAGSGLLAGFGNDWIRVGAVKGFADGSLGSSTALFFEPYADAPDNSGLLNGMMYPEGNMLKMAVGADRAGLQIAIHAVGDKANRTILDIYDAVRKANGDRSNRRWRIEHAQHVRPQDFDDFARLGVIASVQPYHAIDDGRWAEQRIGHERSKTTYAFRTFLQHGVRLAFGTDWDVAPLNPMLGLYAAVTRATLDGKNPAGWFPEEKLTVSEAIEAYTMGSAYAEFNEQNTGSLTPGKLADIVLLNADLFSIPPETLRDVKVLSTIVGGKVVYELKQN
jgi:predicted amidohydrolase YtcJ